MNEAMAIAAVTQALKELLAAALGAANVHRLVGAEVAVSALPPDLAVARDSSPRLNLFLHRVSPSAEHFRAGLTERAAEPRMTLELHYLLTAFAAEELHAEVLVGHACRCFAKQPVMSGEELEAALARAGLAGDAAATGTAGLASHVPAIQVLPAPMSDEALFHAWQPMRTPYRTTIAYLVKLVIGDG